MWLSACVGIGSRDGTAQRPYFLLLAGGSGLAMQYPTYDSANLSTPDVIATEIMEDLEAALAQFAEIATDLSRESTELEK
jgi:hypothetical protein